VASVTDLRISQLARRSGVPASTLRFYESAGLLPAGRTPAGYRVFDETALERLEFIAAAKRLGLPLEDIAGLLQTWSSGSCAEVRAELRPRLAAQAAAAGQRTAELAAFTAVLRQAMRHLDALPERAGRCGSRCRFPDPAPAADTAADTGAAEAWRTAAVACTLDGDDIRTRVVQWHALLDGAQREPIPDGVRLTLPADRAAEIAGLAAAEQRCCAFFDFRLQLATPVLRLEVRAPADAAGHLAGLFGSAPPASGKAFTMKGLSRRAGKGFGIMAGGTGTAAPGRRHRDGGTGTAAPGRRQLAREGAARDGGANRR
jgi:MerR family copper efflux transcriptional regulator